MNKKFQIVDLFSGIGGFSLAGNWMNWETIMFCEINEFCQKILKYHFPNTPVYNDIKKLDYEEIKKRIDPNRPTIVVGGFPCQPYSVAGKRLGNEDDRHLWPYCIETVRKLKPEWCVFENVLGLVNWDGGLVFEQVQTDLETEGYEVQSYVLPACGVDAPHKRDRVWFVAYSGNKPRRTAEGRTDFGEWEFLQNKQGWSKVWGSDSGCGSVRLTPDPYNKRSRNGLREVSEADGKISKWNEGDEFGNSDKWDAANANKIRLQYSEENRNLGKSKKETRRKRSESSKSIKTNGLSWDVANASGQSGEWLRPEQRKTSKSKSWEFRRIDCKDGGFEYVTNASSLRQPREEHREAKSGFNSQFSPIPNWDNFPTQSPVRSRNDGLSTRLDFTAVWDGIKPRNPKDYPINYITFAKWRNESIKGAGNAIVPQVALQIFKTIEEFNKI
jgi:DNA (cytosine-5)-methyltransferase 1